MIGSQREVIATYSWKAYSIMPLILVPFPLFAYFWYVAVSDPQWVFGGVARTHFLIVGSLALLLWIPLTLWFLRQVLLKKRVAFWGGGGGGGGGGARGGRGPGGGGGEI